MSAPPSAGDVLRRAANSNNRPLFRGEFMTYDVDALGAKAEKHGQGHLFAFFNELNAASREKLLSQIAAIEFDVIDRLVAEFVKGQGHAPAADKLEPAPVIPIPKTEEQKRAEKEALAI